MYVYYKGLVNILFMIHNKNTEHAWDIVLVHPIYYIVFLTLYTVSRQTSSGLFLISCSTSVIS